MALRTVLTLIGAGGISSNELAADSVIAGKIADGAVDSTGSFASGVVDAAAIATGAVGTAELADGAVAAVDLGAQVGSLYYAVVVAASTANIANLSATGTSLDGEALAGNDDLLIKDQTNSEDNGLYNVDTLGSGANGVWARMTERDAAAELPVGMLVYVKAGATNGQKMFRLSTFAGNLGVSAQTWEEVEEGITTSGEPEAIGTGDGATLNFDLDASGTIAASIFVNGILQAPSVWAVAAGAGAGGVDRLEFTGGNAPASSAVIEGIILRRL